ncbi:Holliday junction DNA helicase RuvA [Mycoplasma wenyonii str. Massachusetts]|uniref:Holliday junction branch migration complex subunit RuvA n=1 Tax=Mycoplasma wenyonii (strain Massachusetts) TaxID=1197325 RepID=I6ZEI7_MYCWM|nr:Holliday junction branch migration protein RuvA [Mycoplasma wenyonii]AFN65007.1 Holliday junction DNA helicase RuvA [Mycoplasma wenyonii str. Massachusetts]
MYYLKGKVVELQRDYIIVESQSIGYKIHFLNTSVLKEGEERLIYIFQESRLDPNGQLNTQLFGFLTKQDYEIFRFLISIKGIGSKTAQKILTNNWQNILALAEQEESIELASLKGLNLKLANSLITTLRSSKNIKQNFLKLPASETTNGIWDEKQIISSLTEIGYKWKEIRKTIELIKPRKDEFVDLNSIISECLKTISRETNCM